jgi:predicted XRE-type DNA-binding protein
MTWVDPIPALKQAAGAELARLVTGGNVDDIAFVLGTDRSRIADLRRGNLTRFSLERLLQFLTRLLYTVELQIKPPPNPRARRRHPSG